jgi:SAM-dependent methyltransferase
MVDENKQQEPGSPPPEAIVMQMVMGAWVSQTISAVTRLDIPDLLKEHDPKTALELTHELGVAAKPQLLERALRACASVGIFTEDADGRFGATALSDVLTASSPVSTKKLTEIFGASWWKLWGGLESALRTGESQPKALFGMGYWDYCLSNPKEMEDFGEAMKSNSLSSMRGVLDHCDFSDARKVVDVGGGFGHLAIALLKRYKDLRGVVLEVPDLIPIAEKHLQGEDKDVLRRLEFVGGDMFEEVPSGDVFILKHIIHDWDDAHCIRLLQNCSKGMQGDGRVICVDAVLPPMGDTTGTPAKFLDVDMLVFDMGKERTEKEWEQLYGTVGFEVTSITPLEESNFGTSIIEGRKVEVRPPT